MTLIDVDHIFDHIQQHLSDAEVYIDNPDTFEQADESHTVAAALFDLLDKAITENEIERWKELHKQYRDLDIRLTAKQGQRDELADGERIGEDTALAYKYLTARYRQKNMMGVSLQWNDEKELWTIEPRGVICGHNLDEVEQFLTSELARYAQKGQDNA